MPTLNLLYKREYAVTQDIKIVIPTVGEILDNEDEYYNIVQDLTAMPIDLMCVLDDVGIDFTAINEYELFLLLFEGLKRKDKKYTSLVFGDLDLTKFQFYENPDNGSIILIDNENGIRIDRAIHNQIANILRKIHHLEKNNRKPANKEAKEYMLKRARDKMRRNRNRQVESQLESLIVAMVNTEQFKYDFEGTRNLSILQFNESVRQIIKKVDYEHKMHGVYSGTIDPKGMSQDELNWLSNK